jgi:hypothetical protein
LCLKNYKNISKSRNTNHLGLFSGLTGLIIVLLDCHSKKPMIVEKKVIKEFILYTFAIIENNETIMTSYCDGIAGYGFFLNKLKKNNFFLEDSDKEIFNQIDDLLNQIDEILEEQIDVFFLQDNYDILHGAVGLGIYFLERDKLDFVFKILDFLVEKSTTIEEEVFWKKYDKYMSFTTVIDMGNAHGNSSILYFLTKILKKTPENKRIKKLIYGNINFYLKNKQLIGNNIFTHYPTLINANDFINKTHMPENSRLAWCYGDLGALYTLLIVTNQICENQMYNDVVSMLEKVANRRLETESFEIDAGFCHGSSGIAIIFDKIYEHTGMNVFLETSKYWIRETLKHKLKESNSKLSARYDFPIVDTNEQNISLLEGLTGILFCYSKFTLQEMPITEEALFLKF